MFQNLGAAAAAQAQIDEQYKLVINQTLTQGQSFPDLRATIDGDGDFVVLDVYGSSDGPFSIKFRNSGLKDMYSAEINSVNAIGTAQFPVPFGGVRYPANGQVSFSITNLHTDTNKVQIVLSGTKIRRA